MVVWNLHGILLPESVHSYPLTVFVWAAVIENGSTTASDYLPDFLPLFHEIAYSCRVHIGVAAEKCML